MARATEMDEKFSVLLEIVRLSVVSITHNDMLEEYQWTAIAFNAFRRKNTTKRFVLRAKSWQIIKSKHFHSKVVRLPLGGMLSML